MRYYCGRKCGFSITNTNILDDPVHKVWDLSSNYSVPPKRHMGMHIPECQGMDFLMK